MNIKRTGLPEKLTVDFMAQIFDMKLIGAALGRFAQQIELEPNSSLAEPGLIFGFITLAASDTLDTHVRLNALKAIRQIVEKAEDLGRAEGAGIHAVRDLSDRFGIESLSLNEELARLQNSLFTRFPDARRRVFSSSSVSGTAPRPVG